MKILCERNRGYEWYLKSGVYFRGYIQLKNGDCFRGEEAVEYLLTNTSYEEFCNSLSTFFGCYSIIMCKGDEVWIAVDIARSMPLYYDAELSCVSDSAEAVRKYKSISRTDVDNVRALEMYATSYIVGENTIFNSIKQLDIGSSAVIRNNKIESRCYFVHKSQNRSIDRKAALDQLEKITDRSMERLKKVVGNRQVVISLSGGYDSRYLACSLKKNGFENVFCYTYGRKDSFEPVQSKKVADALGYQWVGLEYNDDDVKKIISEDTREYFEYTNNYDYISYIQNFVAFKKLSVMGVIAEDAVVLTGLCNDMPTGFYTPDKEEAEKWDYTNEGCASFVYSQRFIKFSLAHDLKRQFTKEIQNKFEEWDLHVADYESFVHASDCANTAFSHSRCFLHMNNVHEFFGHQWLLPCWDRELLGFWYSMPAEYRYKQNLYEEYITEHIGRKYGVGTKKEIRTVGKTVKSQKLIRNLGSKVVKLAYIFGVPIRRSTDINNFAPLEVEIYKNIKQKNAIKSKYAALTLLLTVYLMEKRHGTRWYGDIKRKIEK